MSPNSSTSHDDTDALRRLKRSSGTTAAGFHGIKLGVEKQGNSFELCLVSCIDRLHHHTRRTDNTNASENLWAPYILGNDDHYTEYLYILKDKA